MSSPHPTTSGSDRSTHPSVARVLAALELHGVTPTVRHLPDAVRTAADAASALGVTPAEIANSLVFRAVDDHGHAVPLLVIASGAHRVDLARVGALTGYASLGKADPDFVREHTGFAIGGVAPVGHTRPVRTVVDVSLTRYLTVWAAAGHSHSVFATSYDELVRVTGGQPMEVA